MDVEKTLPQWSKRNGRYKWLARESKTDCIIFFLCFESFSTVFQS